MNRQKLQLCFVSRCGGVRPTTRRMGILLPFCLDHWQMLPAALEASLFALMEKGKVGRWEFGDARAFTRLRAEALRVIAAHEQEGKTP